MKQLTARSSNKPALRAGCQALTLLVASLNVEILRHLQQGSQPLHDLRRDLGLPPQSTMRLHLQTLEEIGAIGRRPHSGSPRSSDYEITAAGRALLRVGDAVATWLGAAPAEPKELGTTAAKSSIKALVEGWSSHLIRALAARPLSLTELNSLIPRISYPSLERRLTAMRECDLVEAQHETGRLRPYEVTDWLRQAVAPVIAAIDWERTHAPERTAGIGRLDVEAAFLLAIPLLDLPAGTSGSCRLAVEVHEGTSPVLAGVLVRIEAGKVTSCVASLEGEAEAWASGKPLAWLRQMSREAEGGLEIGGDRVLAHAVISALQGSANAPE